MLMWSETNVDSEQVKSFLFDMIQIMGKYPDSDIGMGDFVDTLRKRAQFLGISVWVNQSRLPKKIESASSFSLLCVSPQQIPELPVPDAVNLIMDRVSTSNQLVIGLHNDEFNTFNVLKIEGASTLVFYALRDFGFACVQLEDQLEETTPGLVLLGSLFNHLANTLVSKTVQECRHQANLEITEKEALHTIDITRLKVLIEHLQAGVLFEDQTRHIAHINQEFCQIFSIPVPAQALIGSDCSQAAENSKNLMADPEGFVARINTILAEKKSVTDDVVYFASGAIYARDYIPIMEKGVLIGHLWVYRNISHIEKKKKEIALRDSYLASIVENYPGVFWLKDATGKYQYVNHGNENHVIESHIKTNQELIGKRDIDIYSRELAEKYREEDELVMKTGNTSYIEEQVNRGGETAWYAKEKFVVKLNDEVIGTGGFAMDVSARIENTMKMRLQSTAIESISHAIVITDAVGQIQWVNPSFTSLTGYTLAEVIGKTPALLNSGEQTEAFYSNLWETIKRGEVWQSSLVNRKKDGGLYYEDETITPVFNEKDVITHFIAIKSNITPEVAMKNALAESEQRWQFALEGAGDGLWDWNAVTNEVFYSDSWKLMLGYKSHEIGRDLTEWSSRLHPDDKEKCYEDLEKHLRGEVDSYQNEHRVLHKNGHYIWILDRGKVIKRNAEGKPLRVIGTHTDITGRKMIEEKLKQAIDQERVLGEMKSRFVAIASHEFRTPLATILATAESLMDYRSRMNEEQINARLLKINHQVKNLVTTVEDVLRLSRLHDDSMQLQLADGDIVALCKGIADEINQHSEPQRIICTCFSDSFVMRFDENLIRQIVSNIVSNALKFSPETKPVTFELAKRRNNLIFKVTDQGIGIAENELNRVFEPFQRGNNTTGVSGTGLGLSIVKEAAERLGGEVKLKSKLHRGTAVEVSLPIIYDPYVD